MDRLISLQAAIDALEGEQSHVERPITETRWFDLGLRRAQGVLSGLPSAQPEIIRCKDCRWGREACGNIECFADTNVPPEYHGYEWFCPNGERRTDGKAY